MTQISTTQLKEVRASLGDLQMSPRKVRLVTDLIKNKPVAEALVQLRLTTKKAAAPILKLVNSAVANASNNFKLNPGLLFIKNITVDQGRVLKRYKPRAQGRALPIRHRISKVLVILVEDERLKGKNLQNVKVGKHKKDQEVKDVESVQKEDKDNKPKSAPPKTDMHKHAPKQAEVKRRLFNRKTNA